MIFLLTSTDYLSSTTAISCHYQSEIYDLLCSATYWYQDCWSYIVASACTDTYDRVNPATERLPYAMAVIQRKRVLTIIFLNPFGKPSYRRFTIRDLKPAKMADSEEKRFNDYFCDTHQWPTKQWCLRVHTGMPHWGKNQLLPGI